MLVIFFHCTTQRYKDRSVFQSSVRKWRSASLINIYILKQLYH